MPTRVELWRTTDGETFESEEQANAHELAIAFRARVDAVLPELGPDAPRGERASRTRERETVLRFLSAEHKRGILAGADKFPAEAAE